MKKKQETNVTCPTCGTELAIAGKKVTIAENPAASIKQAQLPKTAHERIEALRSVGVDVSCLFAMQGANGGDYVASNKNGKLSILDDNDPISITSSKREPYPTAVCSAAGLWLRCSTCSPTRTTALGIRSA